MTAVTGLHHVTVVAGDPVENFEFYTEVLGMRLVKRSVNQDAPDTYHLFYADRAGSPGTDLTFFPWPDMGPGRAGTGLTMEVALACPAGTLQFWDDRLKRAGREPVIEIRFGEPALAFRDPHGLPLALVEAPGREAVPWEEGPISPNRQITGLHGVRLWEAELEPTERFLTDGLGLKGAEVEGDWHRYVAGDGGSGARIELREIPGMRRGSVAVGSVHHVAWRVPTPEAQLELQQRVVAAGQRPTDVIDRFWFRSIYFREPGGALFEIATDGPGFSVDEPVESLGSSLVLPPWLEPNRAAIEAALPALPG